MKIAIIVPNLPPTFCGVYDYTRKLAEHWPTRAQWTLVCSRDGHAWPGAAVMRVKRTGASLCEALMEIGADVVALQYTCFGYAENGIPRWLADGLEQFKQRGKALVVVMFHELYYTGRFYTRAFWRNSRQKAVVARLCAAAHGALTGTPANRDEFKRASRCRALVAPVPSNIDPVTHAEDFEKRPMRVAVFGLRESRIRILAPFAWHEGAFANYELVMIGAGLREGLSEREAELIERLSPGKLDIRADTDPGAVSRALASCQVLLCPYTAEEIPKSGAAMAALAHGLVLVAYGKPVKDGPPFVSAGRAISESPSIQVLGDSTQLAAMGRAGREWYERNSAWAQAVAAWQKALS